MAGQCRPRAEARPDLIGTVLAGLLTPQQGALNPATPAVAAPSLRAPSVDTLAAANRRWPPDIIFQLRAFSWAWIAARSLRAPTPLLYEAHRRNIASI